MTDSVEGKRCVRCGAPATHLRPPGDGDGWTLPLCDEHAGTRGVVLDEERDLGRARREYQGEWAEFDECADTP